MEEQSLKDYVSNDTQAATTVLSNEVHPSYSVEDSTAIIPIIGVINKYPDSTGKFLSTIETQNCITKALNDPSITTIVLLIDSPGGTISGTGDLADYIYRSKQQKPIIAYVSDHCLSAAYWIAAKCTKIVASEHAFIGAIGVYRVLTDSSQAAAQEGLEFTLVSSGPYKGVDAPGLAVNAQAVEFANAQIKSQYDLFISAINEGRNIPTNEIIGIADGRMFVASDALQLKLIDEIGTLNALISNVSDNQGIDMAHKTESKAESTVEVKTTPAPAVAPAPADAKPKADDAQATPATLDSVLKAVMDLTSLIKQQNEDDEDSDDVEGDDEDSAKAMSDKDRMLAMSNICKGHAEFAIQQFSVGKSVADATKAFAELLATENTTLRKQIAASADGIEPLALGGNEANTETDPEAIWDKNIGGVQEQYLGKKKYFLINHRHEKKVHQKVGK